jgi:hypothetical protein
MVASLQPRVATMHAGCASQRLASVCLSASTRVVEPLPPAGFQWAEDAGSDLASASDAVREAAAALGPRQASAANEWLAAVERAVVASEEEQLAVPASDQLWLEQHALFNDCAADGECEELESALGALQTHLDRCNTFQMWGDEQASVAPWRRGAGDGSFAHALPPHLRQRHKQPVEEAADAVREAAASFDAAQQLVVRSWLAEVLAAPDSADMSSLYAKRTVRDST